MSKNTDIEIVFSGPEGAIRARMTAAGMLSFYFMNGRRFLLFDGMKPENLGGFLHYEGRSVSAEKAAEFRTMHLA